MQKLDRLYKKNTNGKILQWDIYIDGNQYWAEYGQVDGKIQADVPTICEGKNIGRSNETTPEEQALSEAKAKHKKQLDMKGYSTNINHERKGFVTPMLAHPYDKHGNKLPNVVSCSPKMDGVRCYITKYGAYSRNGKQWVSTKFIEETLKPFFEKNPSVILDGELYCHRYKDDFNKIVSLAKKTKHISDDDWKDIEEKLEFHIFDMMDEDIPEAPFRKRDQYLDLMFNDDKNSVNGGTVYKNVFKVLSIETTKDDFHEYFAKFIEGGYEGIMLRDPDSPYECKRSYCLQKYKEFQTEEFEIIDIEEGTGNRSGKFGRAILKDGDIIFEANARGNDEYYRELLLNKENYIGKMATVRYQNRTPDGKPRFGVVVAIRDYE